MRVAVMHGPRRRPGRGPARADDSRAHGCDHPARGELHLRVWLDEAAAGYQAMDQRRAIKVLLRTEPVLANR